MKNCFIVLIIAVASSGCLNRIYLSPRQVVFKTVPANNNSSEIKAYNTGNQKVRVVFKDSSHILLIDKIDTGEHFILPTVVESSFTPNEKYKQLQSGGEYYFPETTYPLSGDQNSNTLFTSPKKLKYSENNFVLQALTIPLKVRIGFHTPRLKDSLRTQAVAELNAGVALGFKRTWSAFKAYPNEDGPVVRKVSIACAGFLTAGQTNVQRVATTNYLDYDKTEPVVSGGADILFGYQNINIGIAIGKDHLLSPTIAGKWQFDGRIWYGVTLAYDIVK